VKLCYRPLVLMLLMALVCSVAALAAPASKDKEKDKERDKEQEGTQVDAGSFGVFQNGHRVGTETFSIFQTGSGSVIKSEFKSENAPTQDVQSSELRLTANGELRRYEWKEVSPDKAESVVVPNEDFLNQKWSDGSKSHEQPYLLPPSTMILDDYFFIHREVLAWRFLAAACKQDKGQVQCPARQRAQFGTLIPRQHSSASLAAEFIGRETISLKNGPQDLIKLEFKTDASTWQLWLDDRNQFKVIRMSVVGENTVVDRD
jgi:hypothetical protein